MFLTPTYDDAHLPVGLQLHHMQRFWKRLRRHSRTQLKTFYCGEYGDSTRRPHYHAAVFGLNPFGDEKRWDSENHRSETLDKIWGLGMVTISELTTDRMAYVAGYVMKKAGYTKQHYIEVGDDGIAVEHQAPFRRMSQGIGKRWLDKYATDLKTGYVQHEDFKAAIPRYYLDRLKKQDPFLAAWIQHHKDEAREKMPTPDRARLDAAEKIFIQRMKKARRNKV